MLWDLRIYIYFGYSYARIIIQHCFKRGLRFEFASNLPSSCGVSFFCNDLHLDRVLCIEVLGDYPLLSMHIQHLQKRDTSYSDKLPFFFLNIWGQGEEGRLITAALLLLDVVVVWGDFFPLVQAFASASPFTTSQRYAPLFCDTLCLIWGRPYQRVYVWYLDVKRSTPSSSPNLLDILRQALDPRVRFGYPLFFR